jgi:hypothetical protein
MQWTVLTTNNNVYDALATSRTVSETATYSISQGTQQSYPITIIAFRATGSGYGCGSNGGSIPTCSLPTPGSDLATTVDDYVIFTLTNPNGTALTVWYTGPQGNMTQDCGGMVVTCFYEPTPQPAMIGPFTTFFKSPTLGNYTIHLLSTQCTLTPNYCTTTVASGTLTLATSSLTYNRPYWALGLATLIAAGASIATLVASQEITSYRKNRNRSGPANRNVSRFRRDSHACSIP